MLINFRKYYLFKKLFMRIILFFKKVNVKDIQYDVGERISMLIISTVSHLVLLLALSRRRVIRNRDGTYLRSSMKI